MGSHPSMSASIELPARAISAAIMASAAIVATLSGGFVFAVFVAIGAVAALREWHRLVNGGVFAPEMIATAFAVVAAVLVSVLPNGLSTALGAVAGGAAVAGLWASGRRKAPFWHGLGAVYVGLPSVALVLLRGAPSGVLLVLGLFVAVWCADTGALFGGRLIGGPKLVPRLSPNKTWAGFLVGAAAAGLAEAAYAGGVGGSVAVGLGFGVILAVVGHCGDLFESWVKRHFRAKDSGALIPGHGGVLDRIDSLLFAAPACAALVALLGFNPL